MENAVLLRIEVILLVISIGYIFFYIFYKIRLRYKNLGYFFKWKNTRKTKIISKPIAKVDDFIPEISGKKSVIKQELIAIKDQLSSEDKERIADILKRVKTNSSKGYYDTSKTLIIEGLTINKFNRELNLELAYIYEKEKNFKNAEIIYKDLIGVYKDDFVIIKKLAFIHTMEGEYKQAIKLYEKAYNRKKSDLEVIDMLANLCMEIKDFRKSLKYAKVFLKEKPRNSDKLIIKAECCYNLEKLEDALSTYKKVLDLQPYNTEIIKKMKSISKTIVKES